ncbi:MAG: non-reducing end alpha-L-arabinofuranosidase family hydrolase [Planctomycetota bacterium]|jgi:endo-1,4-beta-xylanase
MRIYSFLLLAVLVIFSTDLTAARKITKPGQWIAEAPIFSAGPKGTFDDIAVKDPSIVSYKGKWHLFYTISSKEPGGIGYTCADSLDSLNKAPRYWLTQFRGHTSDSKGGAPQVFYFRPQKLWYLIYQTKDFNRQPVYSTTHTIEKPHTWSKTRNLVTREEPDVKWIDFWIICDDEYAYFFYCRARKDIYVRSTKIEDFPNGFGADRLAFSPMPKPLTEAAHIYKVKGKNHYHMFYESRPSDELSRRYGLATAPHPLGPWEKIADDFAVGKKLVFPENIKPWTDVTSHGEMIRTGYDQKLEYDPQDTRFLIQGKFRGKTPENYQDPGWQLGIIRPVFKIE